jgi:AbrB family looped-hinge helix DNA binding protein
LEEPDVVVVSSKGQVVIPRNIREKLGIGARSKLLVYPYDDTLVMKKLEVKDLESQLGAVFSRVEGKSKRQDGLTEAEINRIVQRYRHTKS